MFTAVTRKSSMVRQRKLSDYILVRGFIKIDGGNEYGNY